MDLIILVGAIVAVVGVLVIMGTTRIHYGFFTRYHSSNGGMTLVGVLILAVGLGIIIFKAYTNGQIG